MSGTRSTGEEERKRSRPEPEAATRSEQPVECVFPTSSSQPPSCSSSDMMGPAKRAARESSPIFSPVVEEAVRRPARKKVLEPHLAVKEVSQRDHTSLVGISHAATRVGACLPHGLRRLMTPSLLVCFLCSSGQPRGSRPDCKGMSAMTTSLSQRAKNKRRKGRTCGPFGSCRTGSSTTGRSMNVRSGCRLQRRKRNRGIPDDGRETVQKGP